MKIVRMRRRAAAIIATTILILAGGTVAYSATVPDPDPCDSRYRGTYAGLRNYLDCRLDRIERGIPETTVTVPVPGPTTTVTVTETVTASPTTTEPTPTTTPSTTEPAPTPTATSTLPVGVTLTPADGGPDYYSKFKYAFPSDPAFLPIGVFPTTSPKALKDTGFNYMVPMRDDQAGRWYPIWDNGLGVNMKDVNETPGFYAGGTFYLKEDETPDVGGEAWGSRAAFEMFGDEMDGSCKNWLDRVPQTIVDASKCNDQSGIDAEPFLAMLKASHDADPNRPTYIQQTGYYLDGYNDWHYTREEKQRICQATDIMSFDYYPVVFDKGPIFTVYDKVKEARDYCQNSRPVTMFVETDHMGPVDVGPPPTPEQTVAEVWNTLIAGARGVQYFDMFKQLSKPGPMHDAVTKLNQQVTDLAPVLNDNFANGYVTTTGGDMSVMTKYSGGHFYIFAAPHTTGSHQITFTLAGPSTGPVTVLNENRTVDVTNGSFTDTFENETSVHIYQVN